MNKPYDKASIYQLALRTFTPEGTLKAAEKMLPYLAELGPAYIQFCALQAEDDDMDQSFWSARQKASRTGNPKNSYKPRDYYHVDEEYGCDQDLKDFIHTAHALGLRVLLDLVYFHCSQNAVFLAEHPDFVMRTKDGKPDTGGWNFPKLNYANPELREYMWRNMEYWIREFDADGFRCDVGDAVPHDFWREGIRRVKLLKPDAYMVNEGGNPEYLDCFDVNYFYSAGGDNYGDLKEVLELTKTARELRENFDRNLAALPEGGRLLRILDNHDTCNEALENRLEKAAGHAGMDAAAALTFLLPGVPFVFNGNEMADDLKHSLFSNRFHGKDPAIAWENLQTDFGRRRFELTKKLYRMRTNHEALWTDRMVWLDHGQSKDALAFVRPNGPHSLLAVISLGNHPSEISIARSFDGLRLLLAQNAFSEDADGGLRVSLLPYGFLIAEFAE